MDPEHSAARRVDVGMALTALHTTRLPRRAAMSTAAMSTLATLERQGPHRITELAAIEGVAQSSMTSLVRGLHRAGLVARHPDPDDRRSSVITITIDGLDRLRAQRQCHAKDYADIVALLPSDEAAALVYAQRAIRHLCELANARRATLGSAVRAESSSARNVIRLPMRHPTDAPAPGRPVG